MSAFVVNQKTFSEIYSGLKLWEDSKNGNNYLIASGIKKLLEGKQAEEIIDVLYRLNIRAVNQRYNDEAEENTTREELKKMCEFNPHISRHQFLKSLECLHYQMSEGEVPETKSYKLVEQLISNICIAIAHSSDDYEQAHWD